MGGVIDGLISAALELLVENLLFEPLREILGLCNVL